MKRSDNWKIAGLLLLLGVAGWFLFRQVWGRPAPGEKGFFYDVSAKKIFLANRDAVPPIRGVDGPEEDGFRAVVYSPTGHPADKRTWKVAYLERCTPELKAKMEAAQKSGEALAMGRVEAQSHRLVRRLEDSEWLPMSAPGVETILNGWATPGPDGATPTLCAP